MALDSRPVAVRVDAAIAALRERATAHTLEGMARYGLPSDHALGVAVGEIKALGKRLGRDHQLALGLWPTGIYEARMLCAYVGDPATLTGEEMDGWCRDFDNWGICDTLCFHLFDRSPHAWAKVDEWSEDDGEFVKRTAFALLASLAGHDKTSEDARFLRGLRLIERAADDDRNFVKKGVLWALRSVGGRNAALHAETLAVARRLSSRSDATPRWIGKTALRELGKRGRPRT